MKNSDNIEKLFKEKFEHFEADVNPNVWSNVQHSINAAPAGGIASSVAKYTIGKIIAGAASVAVITGSVWYFVSSDNKINSSSADKKSQTEISSKNNAENIISENQVAGTTSNSSSSQKQIASTPNSTSSDQNAINQDQSQNISGDIIHETTADASNTDNSSSASQPAHKYGKADQEPTSMIRGNQAQIYQSKSQNNNSSSDNQNTEQAPVATIYSSTESGDAPLTVNFSNQGVAASLNWDFGDGSVSRENAPSHTFIKPGNYVVKLSAKNSSGSVSDKISIEVKSISDVLNIPNIFTPNGDGIDDFFYFETKNIASIEVTIFNMGGNIMASWTTLDGKWDGKMKNGTDALEGNYLYVIQATGTDGVIHPKKGSVTLKRSSQ